MEFKNYKRKETAELREVSELDLMEFKEKGFLTVLPGINNPIKISISQPDLENGSPKIGDMIARNQKNDKDQWLVSENYFNENFEK